jgi:hypothetical protein
MLLSAELLLLIGATLLTLTMVSGEDEESASDTA